jgi:hypothetical protein
VALPTTLKVLSFDYTTLLQEYREGLHTHLEMSSWLDYLGDHLNTVAERLSYSTVKTAVGASDDRDHAMLSSGAAAGGVPAQTVARTSGEGSNTPSVGGGGGKRAAAVMGGNESDSGVDSPPSSSESAKQRQSSVKRLSPPPSPPPFLVQQPKKAKIAATETKEEKRTRSLEQKKIKGVQERQADIKKWISGSDEHIEGFAELEMRIMGFSKKTKSTSTGDVEHQPTLIEYDRTMKEFIHFAHENAGGVASNVQTRVASFGGEKVYASVRNFEIFIGTGDAGTSAPQALTVRSRHTTSDRGYKGNTHAGVGKGKLEGAQAAVLLLAQQESLYKGVQAAATEQGKTPYDILKDDTGVIVSQLMKRHSKSTFMALAKKALVNSKRENQKVFDTEGFGQHCRHDTDKKILKYVLTESRYDPAEPTKWAESTFVTSLEKLLQSDAELYTTKQTGFRSDSVALIHRWGMFVGEIDHRELGKTQEYNYMLQVFGIIATNDKSLRDVQKKGMVGHIDVSNDAVFKILHYIVFKNAVKGETSLLADYDSWSKLPLFPGSAPSETQTPQQQLGALKKMMKGADVSIEEMDTFRHIGRKYFQQESENNGQEAVKVDLGMGRRGMGVRNVYSMNIDLGSTKVVAGHKAQGKIKLVAVDFGRNVLANDIEKYGQMLDAVQTALLGTVLNIPDELELLKHETRFSGLAMKKTYLESIPNQAVYYTCRLVELFELDPQNWIFTHPSSFLANQTVRTAFDDFQEAVSASIQIDKTVVRERAEQNETLQSMSDEVCELKKQVGAQVEVNARLTLVLQDQTEALRQVLATCMPQIGPLNTSVGAPPPTFAGAPMPAAVVDGGSSDGGGAAAPAASSLSVDPTDWSSSFFSDTYAERAAANRSSGKGKTYCMAPNQIMQPDIGSIRGYVAHLITYTVPGASRPSWLWLEQKRVGDAKWRKGLPPAVRTKAMKHRTIYKVVVVRSYLDSTSLTDAAKALDVDLESKRVGNGQRPVKVSLQQHGNSIWEGYLQHAAPTKPDGSLNALHSKKCVEALAKAKELFS